MLLQSGPAKIKELFVVNQIAKGLQQTYNFPIDVL